MMNQTVLNLMNAPWKTPYIWKSIITKVDDDLPTVFIYSSIAIERHESSLF